MIVSISRINALLITRQRIIHRLRRELRPATTPKSWYCQLNDIQTAQPIGGFIPLLSGHDLGAGHLLPFTECPRAKLAIVNRPRQVPTQSEQISYHAIHCKEALSLSG